MPILKGQQSHDLDGREDAFSLSHVQARSGGGGGEGVCQVCSCLDDAANQQCPLDHLHHAQRMQHVKGCFK